MQFSISTLTDLAQKPPLYAPGDGSIWTDPHIATQMLVYHLNPETDSASRKPETIDRIVRWLVDTLRLPVLSEVIDLGCGPGLYTERLARAGLRLTGMDFSANSIGYARQHAAAEGLEIDYRVQNYLDLDFRARFDAAVLIYYDFCPLSDADRDALLARIWLALKPGGRFVLDVLTPHQPPRPSPDKTWQADPQGGFWSPQPHLVLEQRFEYPAESVSLDQYIVVDQDLNTVLYRVWSHAYTLETLSAVLRRAGFEVEDACTDLTGVPYDPSAPTLAVVARKI